MSYLSSFRLLLLSLILMPCFASADQPTKPVNRQKYERVIENQFAGFRIMREEDFIDMYKGHFQDGKRGSLLLGYFDSDDNLDFAAFLIGGKRKFKGDGTTLVPPDVDLYDGAIVICHGDKQDTYVCEKVVDSLHSGLEYSEIVLVPRGSHDCMKGEGSDHITTKIDSIGRYSESGGSFYVRQPDGKYKKCVTSD